MKKISLIIILFVVCNNVKAGITDEGHNYGLYHCDSTNVTTWHTETPDDNSSGRPLNPALMEYLSDQPALIPRSGGGSCLYFDGNNDGLYIPNYSGYIGWPGDQGTFVADISVKWEELPSASGDNRAGLIVVGTWNLFLRNNGAGQGTIQVLVYDTANNPTFLTSDATLNSDTWYEVHAQLSNGVVSLTINGITKTTAMSGTLKQGSIHVEIGQGIYSPRYFKGCLDEIRYGYLAPYPKKTVASVRDDNGSATMFINNKPVAPLMFFSIAENLQTDTNCLFAQQAELAKNAGVHIYTIPINFMSLFQWENGMERWK